MSGMGEGGVGAAGFFAETAVSLRDCRRELMLIPFSCIWRAAAAVWERVRGTKPSDCFSHPCVHMQVVGEGT